MRSAATCVAASFDDIIGNVSVSVKDSLLSETLYLSVLGM